MGTATSPVVDPFCRDAGFNGTRYVAGASLAERYFANRTGGLRPSSGEDLLVATI
jgi:hypothetical protein